MHVDGSKAEQVCEKKCLSLFSIAPNLTEMPVIGLDIWKKIWNNIGQ